MSGESFGGAEQRDFGATHIDFAAPPAVAPLDVSELFLSSRMPRYISHKTVRALKIKEVLRDDSVRPGALLVFEDGEHVLREVGEDFVRRCPDLAAGGYYVVYENGHTSYSPAEAFENGYTKAATEGDWTEQDQDRFDRAEAELADGPGPVTMAGPEVTEVCGFELQYPRENGAIVEMEVICAENYLETERQRDQDITDNRMTLIQGTAIVVTLASSALMCVARLLW